MTTLGIPLSERLHALRKDKTLTSGKHDRHNGRGADALGCCPGILS